MLSKCPCYQCPDRQFLCKTSCPKWAEWNEQHTQEREAINKKKALEYAITNRQCEIRIKSRAKRHKEACGW